MRTVPDFPAADYDRWKTTPPEDERDYDPDEEADVRADLEDDDCGDY